MTTIAVTGFRGVPATWGGIEHHCDSLYSRLAEKGYDITIYRPQLLCSQGNDPV